MIYLDKKKCIISREKNITSTKELLSKDQSNTVKIYSLFQSFSQQ